MNRRDLSVVAQAGRSETRTSPALAFATMNGGGPFTPRAVCGSSGQDAAERLARQGAELVTRGILGERSKGIVSPARKGPKRNEWHGQLREPSA